MKNCVESPANVANTIEPSIDSLLDSPEPEPAARARLARMQTRCRRELSPVKNIYYPPTRKGLPEQFLNDLVPFGFLDGVLTRNHYGSLVLNARHALFIDVDMPDSIEQSAFDEPLPGAWKTTFDDLRTVLSGESSDGFRIYRTAAGFRILGITKEFEPGSAIARDLMLAVGADEAFIRLCDAQKTFRARLTPKPWRCGTTTPPNDFPRRTRKDQRRFDRWLKRYARLCHDRSTCRFLGEVGSTAVHERVAPIVEFHDQQTKAFVDLQLA
jgi:hypothetical protein